MMYVAPFLLSALISSAAWAITDPSRAAVVERIRPLGTAHVESQGTQQVLPPPASTEPAARTGEAIFGQYCSICHETGVAGAPKFRNQADWQPRIDKAGGVAGLLPIVNQGLNAMPPKGTCQDCSQEELKRAIDYMTQHD